MKNEKMLKALGLISDELIEEANIKNLHTTQNPNTTESRKHLSSGKILRFPLAAALIAGLLGVTALAAELFRYEPQISDPVEVVTPTRDGVSHSGQKHNVSFRLPLNEDAPELIEQYYFPDVPEMYEQSFGYAYAGLNLDRLMKLDFFWDVPNDQKKGIRFSQESVATLKDSEIHTVLITPPGTKPELIEVTLGGVDGLLLADHPMPGKADYQYFYWSDGNYVFSMWFPLDFTEEQMGEMIASVREVEDIRPYLISETEEDIKKTFG